MNIFTVIFFLILAKYSPKRTKLHHFKKFSRGSMPPNPPNKHVASPRAAWRFAPCKYPHFYRIILNPPRNEILDTPLIVPNLNIPITCYSAIRRGRLCATSHVGIGHLGTLVYHSFRFRGIRLNLRTHKDFSSCLLLHFDEFIR